MKSRLGIKGKAHGQKRTVRGYAARPSLLKLNFPRTCKLLLDEDTKSFLCEVVVVGKDFRDRL